MHKKVELQFWQIAPVQPSTLFSPTDLEGFVTLINYLGWGFGNCRVEEEVGKSYFTLNAGTII